MRTETKLASMRGVFQKLHLQDVLQSARRALHSRSVRPDARPLRDLDEWSDQSEVAFYEEVHARHA